MLFTQGGITGDRAAEDDGFGEFRLPVYFTLLVAREQVVDAEAWARFAKRLPKHERTTRCASGLRGHQQSCARCRDTDTIAKLADHGPVRLMPFNPGAR